MATASGQIGHPGNPAADVHVTTGPPKRPTPGQRIRLARENLLLAMALYAASHRGLVTAAFVPAGAELCLDNGETDDVRVPLEVTDYQSLLRCAGNQVRGAFALSALQTQRELEAAGCGGPPLAETDADRRATRAAVYLIDRCMARDLITPAWDVPPEYRQSFTAPALNFTLAAEGLHGQEVRWEHFGGLTRYLDLTLFISLCLDGWEAPAAARAVAAGDYGATGSLAARQSGEATPVSPYDGSDGYGSGSGRLRRVAGPSGHDAPAGWVAPDGLPTPRIAVASQATEKGPVDDFVSDACITGGRAMMLAGELYASYAHWCLDNGYLAHSQRKFGLELTARGYERKRRGKGRHWWIGVQYGESVT